jgi:hypothetical protein
MTNVISVGLFRKGEREQASDRAMRMIAENLPNVHIEIVWTEVNVCMLGPYVGFWVNSYELDD